MRGIFKAIFGGLFDAIAERIRVRRGRRQPFARVKCPNCGGRIPAAWDEQKPPGYKWTVDKCPHCYWRYGND